MRGAWHEKRTGAHSTSYLCGSDDSVGVERVEARLEARPSRIAQ